VAEPGRSGKARRELSVRADTLPPPARTPPGWWYPGQVTIPAPDRTRGQRQQPGGSVPEDIGRTGLESRFPGWVIWHGAATGSWWAAPPRGYAGGLVEGVDPAELAAVIRSAQK